MFSLSYFPVSDPPTRSSNHVLSLSDEVIETFALNSQSTDIVSKLTVFDASLIVIK